MAALEVHLSAVRSTGRGRMIAVRGRRQVGKSAAVEHFTDRADAPYVFATGVYKGSTSQQLEAFDVAVRQSRRPLPDADILFSSVPSSWRDALGAVELAARSCPVVVVLDEFPWMTKADPTLEAVLQAAWDRALEKLPVLMVLVGSDVAMMEQLATYGRPLYGRLNQLVIDPLNLGEVAQAFPTWPAAQVIDAYLVVGGFPRLVTDLAISRLTPAGYVRSALNDPFSALLMTGRVILDAEFPDSAAAAHVLNAIGADDSGHPRFKDLVPAGDASQAQTAVSRALALLSGPKALIEMEMPAWSAPTSKLRRYRVSDPYLRFWFRYASDYIDLINRGRADLALGHFDVDWKSWRGRSVEPLVRQALLLASVGTSVREVLPWWSRDGQSEFDAVAMNANETEWLGTVKWRDQGGVTARDMSELARARALVPRSSNAKLVAICRQGERPDGADWLVTAEDLVAAWVG